MKIRSITFFVNPGWPVADAILQEAGAFLRQALQAFEAGGYEVQSARLATVPFGQLISPNEGIGVLQLAKDLETAAAAEGFRYISLGPALPDLPASYEIIPDVLGATQNVFLSGIMASPGRGLSLEAVRACARIIHRAARLSLDGFTNLRFAALANVLPGSPYFPAAYHEGQTPAFALAVEAAGLAVAAFEEAADLMDARKRLVEAVETHAAALTTISEDLARQAGLEFNGIDFSLAPFPTEPLSLGTALERLGVAGVGRNGSLAAAAFTADALDRARFKRVGFSGLMLAVLEDSALARQAEAGALTVNDLLLYSAVCGTGLDTVPLPGDATVEQLEAVLLDVAALAQRLEKPLTARLMPIPGKQAGDRTQFDFAFFANSRVMALEAQPLQGLLGAGRGVFGLMRRDHKDKPGM